MSGDKCKLNEMSFRSLTIRQAWELSCSVVRLSGVPGKPGFGLLGCLRNLPRRGLPKANDSVQLKRPSRLTPSASGADPSGPVPALKKLRANGRPVRDEALDGTAESCPDTVALKRL